MSYFMWAVVAAVFMGVGPIFAKLGLEKPDVLTALLVRSIAVIAVLVVWGVARGGFVAQFAALDKRTWFLLFLEGATASVIGHYAYFMALKLGNVQSVVPVTAAYPLVAMVLSAILLQAKVGPVKWVGAALTALGVYLLQR